MGGGKGNAMAVVDYLSKSMMSALPFIVCAALFRTVAVIMGEGMLGLWSADSEIGRLFVQLAGTVTHGRQSCWCRPPVGCL